MYEWDTKKAVANLVKHGVMLEAAQTFDWRSALIVEDAAHSVTERRYRAIGFIGARLHVMAWTPRRAAIRIIGLRKANEKEVDIYEKSKAPASHLED